VVEDPLGDLVLARPPHILVVAQPGEDPVQDADPGGMPGDALVEADDHHPATVRAFGVQLVELVGQLLLVGGRVEAWEVEAGDVVEVYRIRHGRERLLGLVWLRLMCGTVPSLDARHSAILRELKVVGQTCRAVPDSLCW
jgi:hypothetical protein